MFVFELARVCDVAALPGGYRLGSDVVFRGVIKCPWVWLGRLFGVLRMAWRGEAHGLPMSLVLFHSVIEGKRRRVWGVCDLRVAWASPFLSLEGVASFAVQSLPCGHAASTAPALWDVEPDSSGRCVCGERFPGELVGRQRRVATWAA